MSAVDRITHRLLRLFGLDWDFDVTLRGDRLNRIDPTLFVGARPREEEVGALTELGITHIVSCLPAADHPNIAFLRNHFTCHVIAVHDGMNEPLMDSFPSVSAFAQPITESQNGGGLLIHCEVGVSRSATLATALLMTRERVRFVDAYRRLRAKRPGVLPNIGFASQLQQLEFGLELGPKLPGEPSSLATYLAEFCNVPAPIKLIQQMLDRHDHDAQRAIRSIFDGDIPRVVQGVRQ